MPPLLINTKEDTLDADDFDSEREFQWFLKDIVRNGPTSQKLSFGTMYDANRSAMEYFWTDVMPDNEREKADYRRRISLAKKCHKHA
jgi:hypothetical protein